MAQGRQERGDSVLRDVLVLAGIRDPRVVAHWERRLAGLEGVVPTVWDDLRLISEAGDKRMAEMYIRYLLAKHLERL